MKNRDFDNMSVSTKRRRVIEDTACFQIISTPFWFNVFFDKRYKVSDHSMFPCSNWRSVEADLCFKEVSRIKKRCPSICVDDSLCPI